MRRRDFIKRVGCAVITAPLAARAQQAPTSVVGFLGPGSPEGFANLVTALGKGLSETGYVEGQNVSIEARWAYNKLDQLPALAAELVSHHVAVIATSSVGGVEAAKRATTTIPILFGFGGDPVRLGMVPRLNRPGGNVTGITTMGMELAAKRLGLLNELLPAAVRFSVLVDPNDPTTGAMIKELQAAAATIRGQIDVFSVATSRDIDDAFASLAKKQVDAFLVSPQSLFRDRRIQIVTLAARHVLPAIYPTRDYPEAGGLMSYGASFTDIFRQVGIYAGRILKGEQAASLPVLQATKLEFIINL
jgi:putative tryptophan/tyrosine transport system substrate-binding protein